MAGQDSGLSAAGHWPNLPLLLSFVEDSNSTISPIKKRITLREINMKQTADMTQKRLKILGDDEIKALYQIPHFTRAERVFFTLTRGINSDGAVAFHQISNLLSVTTRLL